MVRVNFDPLALLIACFEKLWPGKVCEVNYAGDVGDKLGITSFSDGEDPVVVISHAVPMGRAADILAHELAHVAAGEQAEHGSEWAAAYDKLHAEYCAQVKELYGDDVEMREPD